MKLSRASLYGIHALASMASQEEPNGIVASHHMARTEGIPDQCLLNVLGALARAGILLSRKGPHGGYRLARPAAKITLLDIVEAIDGPIRGDVPVILSSHVATKLEEVCNEIADQTRRRLAKVHLVELVASK